MNSHQDLALYHIAGNLVWHIVLCYIDPSEGCEYMVHILHGASKYENSIFLKVH